MKTLLAAIDLSPISEKVVEAAGRLASALGSGLVLLNVREPAAAYVPVGAAMDVITAPIPMEPPDLTAVQDRLEAFAAPLRTAGLDVRTVATIALPVEEILERAKSLDASMIILGSHGHGAAYQLFSGSVVTSVLHKAEIPVTVIPAHLK
jgi:nucleotide-binding universal stress UspA family protein